MLLTPLIRGAWHRLMGSRRFYYRKLAEAARNMRGKTILEIGSGRPVDGQFPYSARHLFDTSNTFICSDRNPEYGHKIVDITTMVEVDAYDVILCLNVLEHVFDTNASLENLQRALRLDGVAYFAVPFTFPLHDEPDDYWRFTEHALRRLLGQQFGRVTVWQNGPRRMPFGYFVEARKTASR